MSHRPVTAAFSSTHIIQAAGIAIFHLATNRVVLCYHTRDKYWFLPKGRKNASENVVRTAEREGFEESGYRCRVLPLPLNHCQTDDDELGEEEYVIEPVLTELLPLGSRQYILSWFVGETVPQRVEESYVGVVRPFSSPESFPREGTLLDRIEQETVGEGTGYEPVRHENTGVDEEEALYTSKLVDVQEAISLVKGTAFEFVIKTGWAGIHCRREREEVDRIPGPVRH